MTSMLALFVQKCMPDLVNFSPLNTHNQPYHYAPSQMRVKKKQPDLVMKPYTQGRACKFGMRHELLQVLLMCKVSEMIMNPKTPKPARDSVTHMRSKKKHYHKYTRSNMTYTIPLTTSIMLFFVLAR